MTDMIEKLYFGSPVILQNVAVSLYGMYLHHTRYGRSANFHQNNLFLSQYYSTQDLAELQKKEFRKLINHAFKTVPYYRSTFQQAGLRPEDITDLTDIAKIPMLTKETVRADHLRLVSSAFRRLGKKILTLHTSGTTGSPLTIISDVDSRRKHYAFLTRLRSWFNVQLGMRRASFFGRIIMRPEQTGPPFWRYDRTENNYIFSSYHLSEKNLLWYYRKLLDIKPVEICGYPSSLFLLSKFIAKNNLCPLKTRLIMTTAETLHLHQREIIESALGGTVADQYGCTEMALFIAQCEAGSYHINPEYGIVEVLDEQGRSVGTDGEGQVVCTSFVNHAMPLIRYQLGDRIRVSSKMCDCGRRFPVVGEIIGRTDDILVTPDGRPLGRLDPIFKGMGGIYETQIIQTSRDCLEFKIVVDKVFSDKKRQALLYEIRKRTGPLMEVKIIVVNNIPKDKNGKFRAVISQISNQ